MGALHDGKMKYIDFQLLLYLDVPYIRNKQYVNKVSIDSEVHKWRISYNHLIIVSIFKVDVLMNSYVHT